MSEFQANSIDIFCVAGKTSINMLNQPVSLMEARAKRLPNSATPVAGFGLVSVEEQEIK